MWMRANAGSQIIDYDIAGLVNEAFTKNARLDIAPSGFIFHLGLFGSRHDQYSIRRTRNFLKNYELQQQEFLICRWFSDSWKHRFNLQIGLKGIPGISSVFHQRNNIQQSSAILSFNADITQALNKLSSLPDDANKRSAARKEVKF